MEFESKITAFATGLFLLGSYVMLFNMWGDSSFLLAVSSAILLLVAFRGSSLKRRDFLALGLAAAVSVFFYVYLANITFLPLVVILVLTLAAINARVETFLPAIAGLLTLQLFDPSQFMSGLDTIFVHLSPWLKLSYNINDLGYMVLYHSRSSLPVLLDEVKIFLPLYISLLVAGLALAAILAVDKRSLFKSVLSIAVIISLFLFLSLQKLLYGLTTADFIPDNLSALALPLSCVLLISILISGAQLRILHRSGWAPTWINIPLLAAFFILALVYYIPISDSSDPVIIIDETNSEWEPFWTDYQETFKKDPVSGTNNYFGLLSILASLYDTTLLIDRPEKKPAVTSASSVLVDEITLETLENVAQGRKAVLVVKCVTSPYNESEINAIMEFTARGNGLILVGEHTDIYGMCTYLNPFSERLGYIFLPTGVQDIYTESRGSITQKGEFPPLMARYMVGDFVWETSNSLERIEGADPTFEVITRPSYFSHYRNETAAFFLTREFTDEIKLNSEFARHLVIAGMNYGQGKAVLFTDSTDFNNGVIAFGDHAPFFIAMVEYASRVEKMDKAIISILLLTISLAAIILNRRNALSALVVLSLLFMISYSLAYPLAHFTNDFPQLKGEPKIALLEANENYIEEYYSGMYDLEKIMDKYFQQNLTALIFANPPQEWISASSKVESLQEAIIDIKAD